MVFSRFRKYSTTFIETGTHIGESVQAALTAGFDFVKSVELQPQFYEKAKQRFSDRPNVQIFFGKSEEMIPEMIKDIPIPSVFWLDAHPAGPGTAGHEGWLKRDTEVFQDTILEKEIKAILENGRHVILIDDQHGWATAQKFADMIDDYYPNSYEFLIEDEIRPGVHYKEKVLICLPL